MPWRQLPMSDRLAVLPQYLLPKKAINAFSGLVAGSEMGAITTGIIRRFIPKGSDIGDYTPLQIKAIEDWMNRLHRESLKGRTATEAERDELNKLTA